YLSFLLVCYRDPRHPRSFPTRRSSDLAQVRLQEQQEFAGSAVQYADIRYANHGVHMRGLPGTSPLIGEFQENEGENQSASNNDRSEEHTSELQSRENLVCRLLLEKKNK